MPYAIGIDKSSETGICQAVQTSYNSVYNGPFEGDAFKVIRWIGMKYNDGTNPDGGSALVIHPNFLCFWQSGTGNGTLYAFVARQ